MEQDTNLTQNVNTLFSNLENFTQNEGLLGKPITQGDKTFIPIVSVTLGYGGGNTASKNQQGNNNTGMGIGAGMGNMAGGALGLGAKLSTDAVIIIDKDNVSLMPLSAAGNATQLVDKIPQIIAGLNTNKQQSQQNQNQGQENQQNQ
ncbi:MAG: spore germination protein GerW family protein [Bacillota bacterium]|nr:spore germination protein GerW family protein [Bacillota bacterium]